MIYVSDDYTDIHKWRETLFSQAPYPKQIGFKDLLKSLADFQDPIYSKSFLNLYGNSLKLGKCKMHFKFESKRI